MVARVFVVQDQGRFDLSPAEEFGEIVRILPPMATPFEHGAIEGIRKTLNRFDGEKDWLLLSGNPVLLAVAAIVVANKCGKLRTLQWDRRERRYLPVEVEMGELLVVRSDQPLEREKGQCPKELKMRASRILSAFKSRQKKT